MQGAAKTGPPRVARRACDRQLLALDGQREPLRLREGRHGFNAGACRRGDGVTPARQDDQNGRLVWKVASARITPSNCQICGLFRTLPRANTTPFFGYSSLYRADKCSNARVSPYFSRHFQNVACVSQSPHWYMCFPSSSSNWKANAKGSGSRSSSSVSRNEVCRAALMNSCFSACTMASFFLLKINRVFLGRMSPSDCPFPAAALAEPTISRSRNSGRRSGATAPPTMIVSSYTWQLSARVSSVGRRYLKDTQSHRPN